MFSGKNSRSFEPWLNCSFRQSWIRCININHVFTLLERIRSSISAGVRFEHSYSKRRNSSRSLPIKTRKYVERNERRTSTKTNLFCLADYSIENWSQSIRQRFPGQWTRQTREETYYAQRSSSPSLSSASFSPWGFRGQWYLCRWNQQYQSDLDIETRRDSVAQSPADCGCASSSSTPSASSSSPSSLCSSTSALFSLSKLSVRTTTATSCCHCFALSQSQARTRRRRRRWARQRCRFQQTSETWAIEQCRSDKYEQQLGRTAIIAEQVFESEFSLDQWRTDQSRIHRHAEFESNTAATLLVLTWQWRPEPFPSTDASESFRVGLVWNTSLATTINNARSTNDAAPVLQVIRSDITSSPSNSTHAWHVIIVVIITTSPSRSTLFLLVINKSEIKNKRIPFASPSVLFSFCFCWKEKSLPNTHGKKQQQFVCVYFSLLLLLRGQHLSSLFFFFFSPWIKRHCIIDTAWFVAWLVLFCRWLLDYVAYTHQMGFERCRSFFRPRRKKERLVTRNHLTTTARENFHQSIDLRTHALSRKYIPVSLLSLTDKLITDTVWWQNTLWVYPGWSRRERRGFLLLLLLLFHE